MQYTEEQIREGNACWEAFVNVCKNDPEVVKKAEYMIKNMGWELALDFIKTYFKKYNLPKPVVDVFEKAYKYYGYTILNQSENN